MDVAEPKEILEDDSTSTATVTLFSVHANAVSADVCGLDRFCWRKAPLQCLRQTDAHDSWSWDFQAGILHDFYSAQQSPAESLLQELDSLCHYDSLVLSIQMMTFKEIAQ